MRADADQLTLIRVPTAASMPPALPLAFRAPTRHKRRPLWYRWSHDSGPVGPPASAQGVRQHAYHTRYAQRPASSTRSARQAAQSAACVQQSVIACCGGRRATTMVHFLIHGYSHRETRRQAGCDARCRR
eukprot:jgi/Ulvmu1/12639/UM093_0032.1